MAESSSKLIVEFGSSPLFLARLTFFMILNSSRDVMYAQSYFYIEMSHSLFRFPVGRPLGHQREPRESGTVLVYLFPRGGGE